MPIKINPLLKQFYLFLEKHNARMVWENNLLTGSPDLTRAQFFQLNLNATNSYTLVIGAFTWDKTPEGWDYWDLLHTKWNNERTGRSNN